MLTKMESTPVAADYQAALPVLGVAGSVFEDEGIISNYLYESL